MSFFLLSLILFSLSGSQTQISKRTMIKLSYHSALMEWATAQKHCKQFHSDMITIRNERDNLRFLKAYGWLGLFRENETSQWKWSQENEKATYYAWDYNEPSKSMNCVYRANDTNKWRTNFCDAGGPVTCADEKLLLVKENKTWEDALTHCRLLGGGNTNKPRKRVYDLTSLITEDEHIIAREKTQKATTDEVWTGLRFLAGRWWWVDEEPMLYDDIEICNAEQSCGVIEKKGTANFATRDCRERRNFLCYKWV